MERVNGLINNYQDIDNINNISNGIKNSNIYNNRKKNEINENSKLQIIFHKDESKNFLYSKKIH